MPEDGTPQPKPLKPTPPLWPSLVIAAIPAVAIPVIHVLTEPGIPFDLILLPIYFSLVFGLIWPLIVALQGSMSGRWLPRHAVATVLFVTAIATILLFMRGEKRRRAEDAARMLQDQQEQKAAEDTLRTKGLFAFTEPLNRAEAHTLARYVARHPEISGADLLRMSEQYRAQALMLVLASRQSCPPAALTIIFNNAINQKPSPAFLYTDIEATLVAVGSNPNTPPDILGKLLEMQRSYLVRLAALKNPNVPKADKIAYELTMCGTANEGGHTTDEYWFASFDPDAPPQILECFAANPGYRLMAASSPRTPIKLLEQLTRPEVDEDTRKAAQKNLDARERTAQ